MASLTIRNLDDSVKQRLREQAARHGHSMEEEVRRILQASMPEKPTRSRNIGMAFFEISQALGGVELELSPREPARDPPDFS
jgi:plasmid stability protein